MGAKHCNNLAVDRQLGEFWEQEFGVMASNYLAHMVTFNQDKKSEAATAVEFIGRVRKARLLPDVTIWCVNSELHEIKHKYPFQRKNGDVLFGLECYRFYSLLEMAEKTKLSVLYTIHNYDLVPGKNRDEKNFYKVNSIDHWVTASIADLARDRSRIDNFHSYINGKKSDEPVATFLWPESAFVPLCEWWDVCEGDVIAPDAMTYGDDGSDSMTSFDLWEEQQRRLSRP